MRLPRTFPWSQWAPKIGTRNTSTSANPYPYPTHANPTPHQIFHLPQSATKAEVKARCSYTLRRRAKHTKLSAGQILSWCGYTIRIPLSAVPCLPVQRRPASKQSLLRTTRSEASLGLPQPQENRRGPGQTFTTSALQCGVLSNADVLK